MTSSLISLARPCHAYSFFGILIFQTADNKTRGFRSGELYTRISYLFGNLCGSDTRYVVWIYDTGMQQRPRSWIKCVWEESCVCEHYLQRRPLGQGRVHSPCIHNIDPIVVQPPLAHVCHISPPARMSDACPTHSHHSPELQAVELEMAPILAAHSNKVWTGVDGPGKQI